MRALQVCAAVILGGIAYGQTNVVTVPATKNMFTESDAQGNPIYLCMASTAQATNNFSVGFGNLANIVVLSNVATVNFTRPHGFQARYKLVISGAGTTALNGVYSVVDADPTLNLLTISTIAVPDGTYTDMIVSTDAPLLTKPVWAIRYFHYKAGNIDWTGWSNGQPAAYNQICANRAAVNGASVVTYK